MSKKYGCMHCEHREQVIEGGEYRCANRDSDLWGMIVGSDDACLDWEPPKDDQTSTDE